jgi:hypothetical protein
MSTKLKSHVAMPNEHQVMQKISTLISVFLQVNREQICKMLSHIEFLDKIMLVNLSNA